jgi:hypothetical protein
MTGGDLDDEEEIDEEDDADMVRAPETVID